MDSSEVMIAWVMSIMWFCKGYMLERNKWIAYLEEVKKESLWLVAHLDESKKKVREKDGELTNLKA